MKAFKVVLIFSIGFFINNLFSFQGGLTNRGKAKIIFLNLSNDTIRTRVLQGKEEIDNRSDSAREIGGMDYSIVEVPINDVNTEIGFYGLDFFDKAVVNKKRALKGAQYERFGASFLLNSRDLIGNDVIVFVNNVEGSDNQNKYISERNNINFAFSIDGKFRGMSIFVPRKTSSVGISQFIANIHEGLVLFEEIKNTFYLALEDMKQEEDTELKRIEQEKIEKQRVEMDQARMKDEESVKKGEMYQATKMAKDFFRSARENLSSGLSKVSKKVISVKELALAKIRNEKYDVEEFSRLCSIEKNKHYKDDLKSYAVAFNKAFEMIKTNLKLLNDHLNILIEKFEELRSNPKFIREKEGVVSLIGSNVKESSMKFIVPKLDEFKARGLFDNDSLFDGLFKDKLKEVKTFLGLIKDACFKFFGRSDFEQEEEILESSHKAGRREPLPRKSLRRKPLMLEDITEEEQAPVRGSIGRRDSVDSVESGNQGLLRTSQEVQMERIMPHDGLDELKPGFEEFPKVDKTISAKKDVKKPNIPSVRPKVKESVKQPSQVSRDSEEVDITAPAKKEVKKPDVPAKRPTSAKVVVKKPSQKDDRGLEDVSSNESPKPPKFKFTGEEFTKRLKEMQEKGEAKRKAAGTLASKPKVKIDESKMDPLLKKALENMRTKMKGDEEEVADDDLDDVIKKKKSGNDKKPDGKGGQKKK